MTRDYYVETASSITELGKRIVAANLCKEIVGVQPMQAPVGGIFTMKIKYSPEPKYKFSRAKWYEADVSWRNYREVMEWCTEQFGPRPKVSDAWSRWFDNHGDRIFFRDEKDYLMFLLRWGS